MKNGYIIKGTHIVLLTVVFVLTLCSYSNSLAMMPDEVMRMDNRKCIVLLRGQKPLMLDKITPEEFPAHEKLRYTKITDYSPNWRKTVMGPAEGAISH